MHKQNTSDSEQPFKSVDSRYGSLRPNFHPVDFHTFIGVTRKSTVTPPAAKGKRSKRNLVTPKVTHTDTHSQNSQSSGTGAMFLLWQPSMFKQ